jgi:hypothetical protein
MKAIHGGKAKTDRIDTQKITALLRGGMLSQAYVYPAEMRATRDLLRRRMHLRRKRAELLSHVQHTKSQYHLPEIGKKIASKANRAGVAARFADPAVHKTIAVDLALITYDDARLRHRELSIVQTAKQHEAHTLYLFPTVSGIGNILAHQLARAVSDMLKRHMVFDMDLFLRASRSRAGEPAVSLDTHGMSLHPARCPSCLAASWNAKACIGPVSQSPGG